MPSPPTDAKRLLNYLGSTRDNVWRSVGALSEKMQWEDERTKDAIAELENATLVATWESSAGIFIVPDVEQESLRSLRRPEYVVQRQPWEEQPRVLLGQGAVNFARACHHLNDAGVCVACREFDVSHLAHPVPHRPHPAGCGICLGKPRKGEYCLCCDRKN